MLMGMTAFFTCMEINSPTERVDGRKLCIPVATYFVNTALGQTETNVYGIGNIQICCKPGLVEHGTHCARFAAGSRHEANLTRPGHALVLHLLSKYWTTLTMTLRTCSKLAVGIALMSILRV